MDENDAGCAAPISLWIYGDEGNTEEIPLETASGRFERGHVRVWHAIVATSSLYCAS